MKLRNCVFPAIFACFGLSSAFAADPACHGFCNKLQEQSDYKQKTQEILEKNKQYLEKLDKDDASKRVKVNSNIFVATLRIETAENNIVAIKKQLSDKGCPDCAPQGGNL